MKWIGIISATFLIFLSPSKIHAQDSSQGYKAAIGIRISSNDAIVNHSISFKYFFSQKTAIETLFSFGDPLALGILVARHQPLNIAGASSFRWIIGGGAYTSFKKPVLAGVQGVFGLDYKVPRIPLNFSIDWKPELNLTQEVSFEPAALGFSARFTLQ